MQSSVCTSRSNGRNGSRAGEQIQGHEFILQANPGPAQITFVDILPKADGDFADTLNVGGAGGARAVKADRISAASTQKPAGIWERTIAPAPLNATDSPGLGLGLLLTVIDIDVVAGGRMRDTADPRARGLVVAGAGDR